MLSLFSIPVQLLSHDGTVFIKWNMEKEGAQKER